MKIKQQTVKTAHPLGYYHLASYHCFGVLSGHLRPMIKTTHFTRSALVEYRVSGRLPERPTRIPAR
jgi:hypothetical protein